ncbi:MAG: Na+/H+ antiporter NhaA [Actinobacteria bacterium]|nr:Na+/H+ antiporter NhaA [Actinomycetota bacterium]
MERREFLTRPSLRERGWVLSYLRDETIGGLLLITAALIALVWANSPWGDTYTSLVDLQVGPSSLGLNLSLGVWAADALLAVFFFVVGLELKHELVVGSLSKASQAIVPAAAAIGGMAVPALIFVGVNASMNRGDLTGWGIPMATDIAFALAVLAVFGRRLPVALRAFLLTLAVVDDLGAIAVIAVFYSDKFNAYWFGAAILTFAIYALAQRARWTSPWFYVPLALLAWYFTFRSGVHATVAGVILGLLTRVRTDSGELASPADRLSHRIHPWSAGIAVPLFAFLAAGVDLRAIGILSAFAEPVALGILIGLVVGKPIGVLAGAWLTARFTRASLAPGIAWRDVAAIGVLAGIGFTVALLIAELAYEGSPMLLEPAKGAILGASLVATALAAIVLTARRRHYDRFAAVEEADIDADGIPDVYQNPTDPDPR